MTDDEGRYEMQRVSQGANRLSVWARGFEAKTLSTSPGDPMLVLCDVRLAPAPVLRGTVVDSLGRPVEGAHISACQDKEQEAQSRAMAARSCSPQPPRAAR